GEGSEDGSSHGPFCPGPAGAPLRISAEAAHAQQ
uniref:Leukocyte specific transcript 1 n=1 Tax=Propithecus coquereli TaxID=379532 RepID=A0A2K6FEA6_PROCO